MSQIDQLRADVALLEQRIEDCFVGEGSEEAWARVRDYLITQVPALGEMFVSEQEAVRERLQAYGFEGLAQAHGQVMKTENLECLDEEIRHLPLFGAKFIPIRFVVTTSRAPRSSRSRGSATETPHRKVRARTATLP